MATAEELLTGELGPADVWFEVDLEDRVIRIPKGVTNLGVKSDSDVKHVRFKMPRIYHDSDLSTFKIGIDYTNAEGEPDRYEPTDIAIEGDLMTFTWVVGRHAAIYDGNVTFSLCCKYPNSDKELHTTDAILPILNGTETCELAIVEHTDLLEQWREQLFGAGDSIINEINATAAEKEAELISVAATQKTDIESKAASALETIPDDYTETYNNARQALRTRANAIVETVEGENVSITDASDDYLRGMRLFGKSTQANTTGKNILPKNWSENTYFTLNDDGTVVFSGTAGTSDAYVRQDINLSAGTYYLSGCPAGGSASAKAGAYWVFTQIDGAYKYDVGSGVILTLNEAKTITITVMVRAGSTYNSLAFHPQLEIGSALTTYEPYTGGKPAPNTNYPQDIVSVENPIVTILDRNMFDTAAFVQNVANNGKDACVFLLSTGVKVYTTSYLEDYTRYNFGFGESKQYTISFSAHWIEHSNTESQFAMNFYYDDGTQSTTKIIYSDADKTYTVTSVGDKNVIAFGIGHWMYSGVCELNNIMLVEGAYDASSMPEYEPYNSQAITINRTLPGIPVNSGGNYTDENGQQWICDEIDFERGVYVQRIECVELTGTETWSINAQATSTGVNAYHFIKSGRGMLHSRGCCTHFKNGGPWSEGLSSKRDTFWIANDTVAVFKTDGVQSLDEFKIMLRNAHSTGNPVTVYYALTNPIETPLTETELYAFSQLHSNFPNTTVINDSGVKMEIRYNADTKTYFERFADYRMSDAQVQAAVDAWLTAHYSNAEGVKF